MATWSPAATGTTSGNVTTTVSPSLLLAAGWPGMTVSEMRTRPGERATSMATPPLTTRPEMTLGATSLPMTGA